VVERRGVDETESSAGFALFEVREIQREQPDSVELAWVVGTTS
jgi:hypothetical protein